MKIKKFFETDPQNNIIPNSVIVALRPNVTNIVPIAGCPELFELEVKVDELDLPSAIEKVFLEFQKRLSQDELASIRMDEGPNDNGDAESEVSSSPVVLSRWRAPPRRPQVTRR